MVSEFHKRYAEEVVSKQSLYCRLIGGPAAGDVMEVSSLVDTIFIKRIKPVDYATLYGTGTDFLTKDTVVSKYVRNEYMPSQFYHSED